LALRSTGLALDGEHLRLPAVPQRSVLPRESTETKVVVAPSTRRSKRPNGQSGNDFERPAPLADTSQMDLVPAMAREVMVNRKSWLFGDLRRDST